MKKIVLGCMAILLIISLVACSTQKNEEASMIKEEEIIENTIPEDETIENVEITETESKSEAEIAQESLIAGGEWKPSSGTYTNEDGTITEMTPTTIYGKYAGVGGATFSGDGTFTKFVGVFEAEEPADKTGTYTIDADNHTITLQYSKGEVVTLKYDYTNEGEVMYFIYPEENDVFVRFDPSK